MLYSLHGTIHRLTPPLITVDVAGVGYLLTVPYPVWEKVQEGALHKMIVHTYVREDRLDLYGFLTDNDRMFFSELINLSGVGPKLALELCSIPRNVLHSAIATQDAGILTKVKGVGRKTAEKLLVDLRSLYEKHPDQLSASGATVGDAIDHDAMAALIALGFDQSSAIQALRQLPGTVVRTEDKVTQALRGLSKKKMVSS